MWWVIDNGPKRSVFSKSTTSGAIFDQLWNNCTDLLLTSTNARENNAFSDKDINLLLASLLVMGLSSQPSIKDYFVHDSRGIFGNLWMQQHYTEHIWYFTYSHIHVEHSKLIKQLRTNFQQCWNLN